MKQNALNFLIQIADGLGKQFGSDCEIVIHDLTKHDMEQSIVYIVNGHISNRKKGDGPSKVVLETLNSDPNQIKDHNAYLTKTEDGKILKSSSIFIKDEESGEVAYILSLNYDITRLMMVDQAIKGLIDIDIEQGNDTEPASIVHSVGDLLDQLIDESVALIGKPPALMNKEEKVRAIQYLNEAGAFLITKSGDKVSTYFGISKFTLYSYIDVNNKKSGS